MRENKPRSLQDVVDAGENIVDVLRNAQNPAYVVPVVTAEYSSWRLEQRAWRETAVLFDQSHHMDNVLIRGSDAIKLISDTAINSVANFAVDVAKQYVPVNDHGYVIGDGILFRESKDEFLFVGRAPAGNWLRYHGETGGYREPRHRNRSALADEPDGSARHSQVLAIPDPGAERVGDHRQAQRCATRAAQVLPHVAHEHRRRTRADVAAWDVRRAGSRDMGRLPFLHESARRARCGW